MNPISLSHLKKPSAVLAPSESSRQVGLEGLRNRPVPPIQPSSNNLRPAGKEGLPLCFFTWDNLHSANFFTQIPSTNSTFLKQPVPAKKSFLKQPVSTKTFFTRPSFTNPTFLNNLCWQRKPPFSLSPVSTYHLTCSRLEEKAFSSAFSPGPLFHSTHFFILPLFNFSVCPFFHSALFHQSDLPQITCAGKEGPPLCFHVP